MGGSLHQRSVDLPEYLYKVVQCSRINDVGHCRAPLLPLCLADNWEYFVHTILQLVASHFTQFLYTHYYKGLLEVTQSLSGFHSHCMSLVFSCVTLGSFCPFTASISTFILLPCRVTQWGQDPQL